MPCIAQPQSDSSINDARSIDLQILRIDLPMSHFNDVNFKLIHCESVSRCAVYGTHYFCALFKHIQIMCGNCHKPKAISMWRKSVGIADSTLKPTPKTMQQASLIWITPGRLLQRRLPLTLTASSRHGWMHARCNLMTRSISKLVQMIILIYACFRAWRRLVGIHCVPYRCLSSSTT